VSGLRYKYVITRFLFLALAIGAAVTRPVSADENVRGVQEKLRDGGFYSGEIDGAYSSQLSAALTRYQIRNGLPINGQLDEDTSKALGAKPAVSNTAAGREQSSDTWRLLRNRERRTSTNARPAETAGAEAQETSSPRSDEAAGTDAEARSRSAPAATEAISSGIREPVSPPPAAARTSSETVQPGSAPPAIASDTSSPAAGVTTERLRDYVAAFVLAGLDRNVGAEADFFADRVQYYDQGIMDRENIREDLKRYDEQWPERHFWVAGDLIVEPQSDNRMRVTFPLGFKLRRGNKNLSGKVDKSLVLEPAGDDLQIVAVNERKAE
jgi:peptidoglycan hydrolase-like protein with peptidoglycan-binding domain